MLSHTLPALSRMTKETVGGKDTRLRLYEDVPRSDHAVVIEVERDGDTWQVGVSQEEGAEVVDTDADGYHGDEIEPPLWLVDIVAHVAGVELRE